ncbi:MAG: DUF1003 domain-containing protein [Deltaproteobacteria bacterium]|jgi:uncharacterized membrane protein|nr:DUF1003 domain-containing protein [Deltaproteobacteria bacterium]
MKKHTEKTVNCQVCKQAKTMDEVLYAELVRPSVVETIRKKFPGWSDSGYICLIDLNRFRAEYVEDVLEADKGELSLLESEVVRSMTEHELLSRDLNTDFKEQLSLGQRMADRVAEFGGSWNFILCFAAVLFFWIVANSIAFFWRPFDPYPFILLNLVLSCLAAIQAPVIMMSQNRQEAKDRLRAEYDYRVNLKAELEIRHLNEKIDHLIIHQWERLLEIQQIQMELMEELGPKTR